MTSEDVANCEQLNEQFVSYVREMTKLPSHEQTLLDEPGILMYKRYRQELEVRNKYLSGLLTHACDDEAAAREKKLKENGTKAPAPSAPTLGSFGAQAAAPLFNFGAKPTEAAAGSKAPAPGSAAAISFGSAPIPSFTLGSFGAPPTTGASFGAAAGGGASTPAASGSGASAAPLFTFGAPPQASAPAFAFGGPAPAAPAAGSGFGGFFGAAPAAPAAGGGLFGGFGAPAPLKIGGGEGEDEEEEEQRPPSPSVVAGNADDEWEDVLHSVKAKLFFAKKNKSEHAGEGVYEDRGIGMLQVRVSKETKGGSRPARLVMRNDTGKIFLNASLYPGLKAQVRGGKAVVAMLANAAKEEKLPGAAADAGENELTLTMIKVATPEAAEKLRQTIAGAVPV